MCMMSMMCIGCCMMSRWLCMWLCTCVYMVYDLYARVCVCFENALLYDWCMRACAFPFVVCVCFALALNVR